MSIKVPKYHKKLEKRKTRENQEKLGKTEMTGRKKTGEKREETGRNGNKQEVTRKDQKKNKKK